MCSSAFLYISPLFQYLVLTGATLLKKRLDWEIIRLRAAFLRSAGENASNLVSAEEFYIYQHFWIILTILPHFPIRCAFDDF